MVDEAIEKEYFQYLNTVKKQCDTAAADDKEWSKIFFEKAASPYHYWKMNGDQGTPQENIINVKITNGTETTFNLKDSLKEIGGLHFDSQSQSWQGSFVKKWWEKKAQDYKNVLDQLTVEIV